MSTGFLAGLGAVFIAAFLVFVRWLMRKATVDVIGSELVKVEAEIKKRASLERESIDQATANEIKGIESKSDDELEKEINR